MSPRYPSLVDVSEELSRFASHLEAFRATFELAHAAEQAGFDGVFVALVMAPLVMLQAYVAPGSRHSREPGDKQPYHLTLLAKNNTGYANLVKLSSKAWLEGFHYFPRSDWEILTEHAEGLICLSGCLSAEIPKRIVAGDLVGARKKVAQYRELFGDRFYLELQDHGIPTQGPLNDELVKIGK